MEVELQKKVEQQGVVTPFPHDICIHELFEAQVHLWPENIAIRCGEEQISYSDLNDQANRLAAQVRRSSVGPDTLVAVCIDRSIDTVVAILAVLKAGAAYLPIDPTLPLERICYMLGDSRCTLMIARSQFIDSHALPDNMRRIRFEDAVAQGNKDARHHAFTSGNSRDLAYVIYTSGSTGNPKGVMIEHRGLCNAIYAGIEADQLTQLDRTLHLVSFSFDAGTYHLFTALCSGGTCVLTSRDEFGVDPVDTLKKNKITRFTLPVSALETIPIDDLPELPDLRLVGSGGDSCNPVVAEKWAKRFSFVNVYGPTETTIIATSWRYEKGFDRPPIGRPIANTFVYILDEDRKRVPPGAVGEMYIGGVGVGRGYMNRPKLTKESFLANPFGEGRLYRTGDMGMLLPDGNIEFRGRGDSQVKVNGFRIELGEVEAAILVLPVVKQAIVLALPTQLVAYVVPKEHTAKGDAYIQEQLRLDLPDHMIPGVVIVVSELPSTHNGKVDRALLKKRYLASAQGSDSATPQSETERILHSIWTQLLGVDVPGIDSNFFASGGDSLLAVRLCSRIESEFGISVEPEIVFRAPTIAQMAPLIEAGDSAPKRLLQDLYTGGTKVPVYFCQVGRNWYELHEFLGDDRPLFGLKPFYGEAQFTDQDSMETIVTRYRDEILAQGWPTDQPVILAGFSLGCVLAIELSRQLEQAGKKVLLLFLLDPSVPDGLQTDGSAIDLVRAAIERQRQLRLVVPMSRFNRRLGRLINRLRTRYWSRRKQAVPIPVGTDVDTREHNLDLYKKLADEYEVRPYAGDVLISYCAGYRRRAWSAVFTGRADFQKLSGPHGRLTRKGNQSRKWMRCFSSRLESID